MIKTDFSHTQKIKSETTPFFAFSTVLYGLNFGLLGAMVNAFLPINFFGDFSLYFGQILVLFCLVTRGLNAAIIAVFVASTVAALHANDAYLIVIYSLEMLVVHVCMRKGYFLFESAMAFWLLLGVPLTLCLHALTSFVSPELLFISGVSRALNGLICVSVVAICCWFLPSHLIHGRYYSTPPKLSSLIFSLCMLTVTLPAMVISLFLIWQSTTTNEKNVQRELEAVTLKAATINNIELQRHLNSVQTISTILENDPDAKLQKLLTATANNYNLFSNVVLTNAYGKVISASTSHSKYSDIVPNVLAASLNARHSVNYSNTTTAAYITDALIDKGFNKKSSKLLNEKLNNTPYVYFVAPIILNSSLSGSAQGVVPLEQLIEFNNENIDSEYQYVITDSTGKIIARSNSLSMPLLSNFDYVEHRHPLITNVNSLAFNQEVYLYDKSNTNNGWTIILMTSPNKVTSVLVDYFFILVLATFSILAAFAFIAKSLSRKITQPLVDIAENFPNAEFHPQIVRESQVSSEMVKLTHKLIDSHEVMSNFHQQLSQQVHNKTKQLKQLNRELYSIAQKDSLTQLLNRAGFNRLAITSYRNCVRNHINMSLIFIDIDHFKVINDTHGHPFGDKCIIAVAKTIQKHCKRDTDVLGRYGGEEFIIMIVGGEIKEHADRVSLIKDEIEALSLSRGNNNIKMTISAGICSLETDFSIEYEDLLQLSDNQLYISKREGRNKISLLVR